MEERRARKRGPRGLLVLAVVLGILVAAMFAIAWLPLRGAREEWREGRTAEAILHGERWSRIPIWRNQYHQFLAAAYLSTGNRAAAEPHLGALRGSKLWISSVTKSEVAKRLFAGGRYEDFLLYDTSVASRFGKDEAALYRAAALLAVGRVNDAEAAARAIDREDVDEKKLAAFDRAIAQRKEGSFPWAVDRSGKTIAGYQAANRDVVAVNTDFAALVEKEAGKLTLESLTARIGANDVIETTLDSEVQRAAMKALGGFRGSLVAIDPSTNEILAIASNRGGGPLANLALEGSYEPGSVMKVVTGLGAAGAINMQPMFPYRCDGVLEVDGRRFGDWKQDGHGVLPDFDEALARSCNVVFADLGIRLGADRLQTLMSSAGFDGRANLGLFIVPLGVTVGKIFNKFETGFYSIGIEHQTTNTLHLAMIASMMANRGTMVTPRLLRARRSILGEEVESSPQQTRTRVASREAAERVVKAMVAVATRPQGTGRRAPIDGVPLAIKTGTAGKESEFHAAIIAFAPVETPKIAFALLLEESGPAEFAGAKVAHDFLQGIEGRLR